MQILGTYGPTGEMEMSEVIHGPMIRTGDKNYKRKMFSGNSAM